MVKDYRFGVVGVFIREDGKLLICERANRRGAWQFPQGGIDPGETPEVAIVREVREEIGTSAFKVIRKAEGVTTYDFPAEANFKVAQQYRGQKHHWFLLEFEEGAGPDLDNADDEFCDFRWEVVERSIVDVISWKADAYLDGLKMLDLWQESEDLDA